MKKIIPKDVLWKLSQLLPSSFRGFILRRLFTIDRNLPEGTIIKRAETVDELEQAFQVAFEAYKSLGLVTDRQVEIRTTKYHLLPTTSVIILKIKNEVVATLSIVVDSALGLPLEELFNISEVRERSSRVAEVSTLAIKRGYRRHRGRFLFPIFKYLLKFSTNYLGVDAFVIATHPRALDFYEQLLGFEPIESNAIKSYGFVNGALATAQFLNLNTCHKTIKKLYRFVSKKSDLCHYFSEIESSNFEYPESSHLLVGQPVLSSEQMDILFDKKSKILSELNDKERMVIKNYYRFQTHNSLTNINAAAQDLNTNRTQFRYQVFCSGKLMSSRQDMVKASVLEVSDNGVKLNIPAQCTYQRGDLLLFVADLSNDIQVDLHAKVVWSNPHAHQIAILLIDPPKAWTDYISALSELYRKYVIAA